jgi:hypothetical protein
MLSPFKTRAIQDGTPLRLAIVEMKLGFNLDLLLQAADRLRLADEVWLAVPATRRGRDRDPRVHRLCRLIGFGLLAVNAARDRVEVLAEPGPYQPRPDRRRRARLLSEHARRKGDPSPGGSTRQPVMTAYRQQALDCALLLRAGARPPAGPTGGRARCWVDSSAQCIRLVRTHPARRVSAHRPWRGGVAALV